MRTPYGFVSFVAAILAACSTVTSLVVPTDDSSLAQAPESDARPSTLPIRNIHVATRDDVVSGNTTLLHNDGSFWMAPLADDDDDDEFEIPAADQPDLDLVSRYGPGAPPDKHDPHKVYCKDFKAITDETSDASPWIEDCLGIIPNIQPPEHGAHWKFMIGSTRKIVSHKSCVLAVSANHIGQRGSWMNVGNMDVIAVIDVTRAVIWAWNSSSIS